MWDTFIPPNADAILNIPLRHGGCEDFLAWEHEKSGIYSVRLHYQAFVNQNERPALNEGKVTGSSVDQQQIWKAIWKLSVVPKVEVFWWRVIRGIIPDEHTLKHKKGTQHFQCLSSHG